MFISCRICSAFSFLSLLILSPHFPDTKTAGAREKARPQSLFVLSLSLCFSTPILFNCYILHRLFCIFKFFLFLVQFSEHWNTALSFRRVSYISFGIRGIVWFCAFSVRRSAGCRMFRIRQIHARTWHISTACFYTPPYCSSISATPFSTRLISFRSSDRCLILLSFFTVLGTDLRFSFLSVLLIWYYTFCGFFLVCCFSDFRIF